MDKKTFKLGIILIILIALAYLYQGPFQEWKNNLGQPDNFLAGIDISQIDKVEITKNNKIIILEKQVSRWKIAGTKDFYVDESLENSLNKALEQAINAKAELVSSNKDKKSEFKTDESGVRVKLYLQSTPNTPQTPSPSNMAGRQEGTFQEGNLAADFIVGKTGSDFASSYVSEPNSDKTYKIKVSLSGLFSRNSWHDKNIFSSDKEKISKIRFQYPNREFMIAESAEDGAESAEAVKKWEGVLPYKFSVNKEKIDKILNIMANLTAVKIPEQTFENTGLEKNLIIIQATGEGIDNTLMIGNDNGEELYYAKKGDSDNIYLITKEQRDELDKNIQDLK